MKSRKSVFAVLMMSTSLIALTACEEPKVDASIYESLEQCKRDPLNTPDQCDSSFKEAQSQHAAVAPKYATAEDCQADFGKEKCEVAPYRTSSGGSVFMPLMAGYMMGSLLGGRGSMMSQPLYRSSQSPNSFRTAENRNVGSKTGRTTVAKSATSRPSFKSATRSRGGFGSSGRRFGSGAT
ncbi:MAG: DUF1190 domain-containing protein [Rhodospirillales bacterium]|nr:DUF1190 domain-containing protein [Rhodospirillales bacterium]MDP7625395.1 DUF1190 domain-containing protein [Rhodospirillales bacterium]|tara:strand:+ start:658 stop:1200 length:543 start_codon:yes stop_codon:yes gene_type:complete